METKYDTLPLIQLIRLCTFINDDHGSGLSEADFAEVFLMMLEGVAMTPFKNIPEQHELVADGYFVYQIITERRSR
jgi:hypothetical protein